MLVHYFDIKKKYFKNVDNYFLCAEYLQGKRWGWGYLSSATLCSVFKDTGGGREEERTQEEGRQGGGTSATGTGAEAQ